MLKFSIHLCTNMYASQMLHACMTIIISQVYDNLHSATNPIKLIG